MITIVAAVARGGAIGRAGKLPWHFPEDLAHFKALTMGHAVVMGRKTWESIPAKFRPLPGRANVVLTRSRDTEIAAAWDGATTYADIDAALWALRDSRGHDHIDIIGGAEVYAAALPVADRLEITEVDVEVPDADAFFPQADLFARFGRDPVVVRCPDGTEWREVERRPGKDRALTFTTWRRA